MRNKLILIFYFFLIIFSGNAYSHTGEHDNSGIQGMIHFATSPDHLPFIVLVMIILALVIHIAKRVAKPSAPSGMNHTRIEG